MAGGSPSEGRLGALLEHGSMIGWMKDEAGRIVLLSPNFERRFGVTTADWIGKTDWEIWPRDIAEEFAAHDALVMTDGVAREFVEKARAPDGAVTWWLVNKFTITESSGARFVGGTTIDITARKQAEDALRRSESLRTIGAAVAGLALAEIDYASNTNHLSAEAARLFDLGDAEVVLPRSEVHARFHESDRPALMEKIAESLDPAGAGWFEMDHRIRLHNGGVRWLRVRKQVFFSGEGTARRPSHAILAALDVTLEKDATNLIRENEEFLRVVLDRLPQQIAVLDESGRIVAINESWRKFADGNGGASAAELGSNYLEICHAACASGDDHARDALAGIEALFDGRRKEFSMEYPCHGPDEDRWFVMHAARWQGGVILSHTDITPQKNAEFALAESDQRKDEFLATLAHELRNPLAPISAAAAMLKSLKLEGEQSAQRRLELYAMLERQAAHLVRLVDDLLDVARISKGKIELQLAPVNVADVVASAIEANRPLLQTREHRLSINLPQTSVTLHADAMRIAQVVTNLLNNACKYTPPGGNIALDFEARDEHAVITVRDDGVGLSAEQLESVFELFTQVRQESGVGGLGIGLALVRRLVEMHGEHVEARSDGLGRGSAFMVHLPLSASRPIAAHGVVELFAKRRLRALVIDDDRDVADSFVMLLQTLGVEAHVAYGGITGMEALEHVRPQLVFVDLGMPGMNGYQVAQRIRREREAAGLVLVALTGWGQEQHRRRCFDAGFDHHLTKPASLDALQRLLARV